MDLHHHTALLNNLPTTQGTLHCPQSPAQNIMVIEEKDTQIANSCRPFLKIPEFLPLQYPHFCFSPNETFLENAQTSHSRKELPPILIAS